MSLILMLVAAAAPAAAQVETQAAAPLPPPAVAPDQGIIAYPASFFADTSPTSALDMVQRLPGFQFDKGQAVRGLAAAAGNVLIDGEAPVAKNDTLDEILKRIPVSAVLRIELIRGGAGGYDMQGRPVLANVVQRDTSGFKGATTLSASSIDDGRVLSNIRTEGQWRWPGGRIAEFSILYGAFPDDYWGDGPRVRLGPNGATQIQSNYEAEGRIYRKFVTGAYETPLAGGKLRLNGAYQPYVQDFEVTDRLIVPGTVELQHDTYAWDQTEFGARYTRDMSERITVEAVGFQQWREAQQDSNFRGVVRRLFSLNRQLEETVGRGHVQFRQSPALTWEFGGEAALNTLEAETKLVSNGVPVVLPAASVAVEEKRGEVFGTVTWRASDHFNLEAGVRQERTHVTSVGDFAVDKTYKYTKPRIQANWSPTSTDEVRLRIEREVGQLEFNDFVASPTVANTGSVVAGNPDLAPQDGWMYEGVYERRFGPATAVSLTFRHLDIKNVVDRVPLFIGGVPVADGPGNLGKGRRTTLTLDLSVPLDRWGVTSGLLKGSVTIRRSSVTDPLNGVEREISSARPIEWDLHYVQDLAHLKTTVGIDINKGASDNGGFRDRIYRFNEIENRKWDPWVNLFAEYKPYPNLQIRLEVQNLTERSFQRERVVFVGARDRTPLLFDEVRDLRWGRVIALKLRRTY